MINVILARPVPHPDGSTVTALNLREPTGLDLVASGLPFILSGQGGAVLDMARVFDLAADLAGVPMAVLHALSARDSVAVMKAVIGFFGDAAPTA